MHLKIRTFNNIKIISLSSHLLSLVVIVVVLTLDFISEGVTGIKIKSGKVTTQGTTTNSPNSLNSIQPKFTPSQQIVTDLLTPQFIKSSSSINSRGSVRIRGKGRKKGKDVVGGVQDQGPSSSTSSNAWDSEYPRVPMQASENSVSSSWNNLSDFPTTSTSTKGPNSFTFTATNLADTSWIGMSKSSSPQQAQAIVPNANNHNDNMNSDGNYMQQQQPVSVNRILYIPDTINVDDDDDSSSSEEHRHKKKKTKSSKRNKKSQSQKGKKNPNATLDDLNNDDNEEGTIDIKIQKLEDLMTSLSKNVDVMRQNTQVISKGFNILSTRFNKISSDQDELNLKLDKKFLLVEEGIIRMQKEVGKKLKEIETKGDVNLKNLKKSDHDLLEAQITNGQEHKRWMETLSGKLLNFKSDFDAESKVLAEMVKALAEIQKKEKAKLDQMGKSVNNEMEKFKAKLEQNHTTEDKHFQERLGQDSQLVKRVERLEKNLETTKITSKNESELFKKELGDLSKYVDDKMKRLDESIQEQNMAHNLAHEHFAASMSKSSTSSPSPTKHSIFTRGDDQAFEEMIETSPIYPLVLDRLNKLERNISKNEENKRKIVEKVESMEDTDLSILSRIADLRNSQAVEMNWAKAKLIEIETRLRDIADAREAKSKFMKNSKNPDFHTILVSSSSLQENGENMLMEVGGLSMTDPTFSPPTEPSPQSLIRTTDFPSSDSFPSSATTDLLSEQNSIVSDRVTSVEENVAELWRGQNECRAETENVQGLIKDLQESQEKYQKDSKVQLKHFDDATKLLRDLLRNSTYKIIDIQRQVEELEDRLKSDRKGQDIQDSSEKDVSARGKTTALAPEDVNLLREEIQSVRDIVEDLLTSNKNVTKAQEFFLLKLLEMDQEHKKDNQTLGEDLYTLRNKTEDTFMEISRSEDRLNKVVQQFSITDAEQVKIREELWNIKDRLNGVEENYVNLWKTNKKFVAELEQVVNSVDNINLVHGNELQQLSTDVIANKEKLENVTKTWRNLDNRLSNVELSMDLEVGNEPNTSELGKLKQRLSNTEKDIAEIWKSSEILSFQQQVMAENFKFLEATHENDTTGAATDRVKVKQDAMNLMSLYQNLTKRVQSVEKCTNPPYETKTINFMIPDWQAISASESSLKDEYLEYELGSLLPTGYHSSWKTYLGLNGTHLSLFNMLLTAESPMFNEFEVEILDGDQRIFTTFGPEQHLYKKRGDSISVSNVISRQTLENPKHGLLSRNTLRLRLKVRVYPKIEKEQDENNSQTPSEKQLVLWEVGVLSQKLKELTNSGNEELFQELNVTKEFVAGHSWNGFSLWRAGLLAKTINRQVYLGLNMELVQRDGDWKELEASYNVTMLDAHSRIAKEFSISTNDFTSVSARHSYFMLVKDVSEILTRGDSLTFRIYFDLQAKRKAYDVEVIRQHQ